MLKISGFDFDNASSKHAKKSNTYFATDRPDVFIGFERNNDFKMCIFDCDRVPTDGPNVNPLELMRQAIECIGWTAKARVNLDGSVTDLDGNPIDPKKS